MLITATQMFEKWLVLAALLHATSSSPKNILSTGYSVKSADKTRSSLGCQNIVGCDRPFSTNVYARRAIASVLPAIFGLLIFRAIASSSEAWATAQRVQLTEVCSTKHTSETSIHGSDRLSST
jgi:hypothetical protein